MEVPLIMCIPPAPPEQKTVILIQNKNNVIKNSKQTSQPAMGRSSLVPSINVQGAFNNVFLPAPAALDFLRDFNGNVKETASRPGASQGRSSQGPELPGAFNKGPKP